jgi:SNF2 family DNA or RNA helicase
MIYIKRQKKDVLKGQLPQKKEDFILCDLSPLQKEVYRHVIKLPDFDLVKYGSRPCDCGINQLFFRKLLKLKGKAERLKYMRTNKSSIMKQSKCCKRIPENPRNGEEGEPFIDPDAAIWRTLDIHCIDHKVADHGCEYCPWCCCLPCLTKLNKLSSHLGLLQAKKTTELIGSPAYITYFKEREFAKVALAGVVDRLPGGNYDRNDGIMDDHYSLSGKLRVLDQLLTKDYNENGKVLLFSHSTQSMDLIENWLKSRGSFEYLRMDGSTPQSKRHQLTDEFNKSDHIFLFLLSIKAAGLGLNLTSANRVIMCTLKYPST